MPIQTQWQFKVKPRTTQGTKGRRTQVETNHLPITYTPKSQSQLVYHYDIKFEPERPKRLYRAAFLEFKRKACGNHHPAFDGKANMYSYGMLPFQES
ncbi:Agonaute-2, partial [Ephemera danica]